MSVMNKSMPYAAMARIATVTVVTAVMALVAGPVAAQEADNQADKSVPKTRSRLQVEEIIVTARKKAENLQKVPMAITAFSADTLERAGIDNLDDVAAFTPGLTFSNLFGEFLPVPVIRGVAPTAIFGENNVAVFIDGVFVSGREGLNASQLDLERIEVLKGPQSTKYGRNAFAGAINYVTARPGDELEGEAKINVGNEDKRQVRVTVSGPLMGDMLTGRIALGIDEWSGSYNNSLSNLDIGGYQYKTLQTSLWFTPTDTLDVQWALYLSDDEIDDSARATLPANCEDRFLLTEDFEDGGPESGPAPLEVPNPADPDGDLIRNGDRAFSSRPQNFCGTLPSLRDNTLAINDQATGEERELLRSSLNINWDTGWGTITALTGFSNTQQKARADSNQTQDGTVPFFFVTTAGDTDVFPAELTTVVTGDETTEWSQELRYSSPLDKQIRFEVGGYWFDVHNVGGFTDFTARLADGSGQRLPDNFAGLFPGAGVIGDAIFGPRFQNTVDDPVPTGEIGVARLDDTQSWSGFAGIEVDFFDERLIVDAGARYTKDSKKFRTMANAVDRDTGEEFIEDIDESRRFDYWTWRGGLSFHITDDNMIYASVSNGKKSGGMDFIRADELTPGVDENGEPVINSLPVNVVTDFDIEKITAFELGNKGTVWDGRAQYDLAIFYNDWNDILMPQILDFNPDTNLQFEQPEGADLTGGDATTYGVEASLTVILTEHWDISLSGAWTSAEYDEAELASFRLFPSFFNLCPSGKEGDPTCSDPANPEFTGRAAPASIKGKELLRQSKVQGAFTLNYTRPVGGDWEFFSRSDVLHTGSQWVGAANQAKVPDHTNVNQRLGLETESIRLEFWIENLFDQDNAQAAFRDVTFNNTHLPGPPTGTFSDMFPFRMSISHPRRRTFGISALVKF